MTAEIDSAFERRAALPSAPWTEADIEELARFNAGFGAEAAADNARDLADPETLCVMTGQQAGLLGGPLYTLFKALGAVALAESLQERLGRRVVPCFWVASDDHDFEEIRVVTWPTASDGPRKFFYEPRVETGALPVYAIPVSADLLAPLLTAVADSTPPGARRDATLERLRAVAEASANIEDFFCRCMVMLLGKESPLVWVSPRLSCLKRVQTETLAGEFEAPGRSSELLIEAGKAWEGKPPAHRRPGDVNTFLIEGQVRARLTYREGRFASVHPASGDEIASYSASDMESLLSTSPERFSANVATRPVVQDARFASIAYLAGPGEQAYHRQIAPLYNFFGVCRPAVIRRPGGVLIEPAVARALGKLDVTAEAYMRVGGEALMAERAKQSGTPARVSAAATEAGVLLERLADDLRQADPAVGKGAEKLRSTVAGAFERLEQRAVSAAAREDQTARERCRRIDEAIRPLGRAQERTYGAFFPFHAHLEDELAPLLLRRFRQDFAPDQIIDLSERSDP